MKQEIQTLILTLNKQETSESKGKILNMGSRRLMKTKKDKTKEETDGR